MLRNNTSSSALLTPREFEVINLLAAGFKKQEIAKILGNSSSTVEKQIASACQRSGCRSSCQIIKILMENNQLPL